MNIFRRTLDAGMKLACQDGLTNSTRMAKREEVTEEEEKIMWQKDLLGCQTAKSLLYTIYFYNGKLFGIRAKEHRNLRVNNFRIDSVSVTYDESTSKTFHGGLKDLKYSPRVTKHICCSGKDVNHFPCIVNCYGTYIEKVKDLAKVNEAFYFKPNNDANVFEYYNMVLGIHTLNKILPDLCESAGFSRKTSHCLRVTCATRLFQSNVEDKLIRQRTGHRSNALLAYEKESHQQNIKVSKILGPPEQNKNVEGNNDVDDLFFDLDVPDDLLSTIPLPGDGQMANISNFDVSDEFLSTMPLPGDKQIASMSSSTPTAALSGCVFNNCTINLGKI